MFLLNDKSFPDYPLSKEEQKHDPFFLRKRYIQSTLKKNIPDTRHMLNQHVPHNYQHQPFLQPMPNALFHFFLAPFQQIVPLLYSLFHQPDNELES
ncbi:hypothetical protein APU02_03740 [Citrobacter sp. 50677481]|nr:hypothetical protein APU02_03740 [Citrobacter sp. 50677481]